MLNEAHITPTSLDTRKLCVGAGCAWVSVEPWQRYGARYHRSGSDQLQSATESHKRSLESRWALIHSRPCRESPGRDVTRASSPWHWSKTTEKCSRSQPSFIVFAKVNRGRGRGTWEKPKGRRELPGLFLSLSIHSLLGLSVYLLICPYTCPSAFIYPSI